MNDDKLDLHHRQQLSALMDGDLAPDAARFLLRRLQHDEALKASWERWQLCGDALRGQACAPAPAGFAERVAAAIAAEAGSVKAAPASHPHRALARWGGGALAASVALLALLLGRPQAPEPKAAPAALASQAPAATAPAAPATPAPVVPADDAVASAAVAVASLPRTASRSPRGSATRNQQVARASARRAPQPGRATGTVAETPAPTLVAIAPAAHDPFRPATPALSEPAARPWPRSLLQQYPAASGAFNASYGNGRRAQTFYPFEPSLPQSPPTESPDSPRD